MTKKDIATLRESEQMREKITHNILTKFAKKKGLSKFTFDDGFYVFADTQENADKKHNEWIDSRVRDKNGTILKIGDVVHDKWGYDLVVHRNRKSGDWFGMLVCPIGHSCETIPSALNQDDIELINM